MQDVKSQTEGRPRRDRISRSWLETDVFLFIKTVMFNHNWPTPQVWDADKKGPLSAPNPNKGRRKERGQELKEWMQGWWQ